MAWIAVCEDLDPVASAAARTAARDAHFAYIESILDRLLVAGPLMEAAGGEFGASLFVYDVATRAEAEALLHADPYYQAGIYGSVRLRAFQPAAGRWIGGTIW